MEPTFATLVVFLLLVALTAFRLGWKVRHKDPADDGPEVDIIRNEQCLAFEEATACTDYVQDDARAWYCMSTFGELPDGVEVEIPAGGGFTIVAGENPGLGPYIPGDKGR